MPSFRGMRQTRRGGSAGSYADVYGGGQPAKPAQSAPAPTPSGRGRYQLHGGGYLRTTPTEGHAYRQDVTVYGNDDKPQYRVGGAEFHFDEKKNEASFGGGTDLSSGKKMPSVWKGQTLGGNTHRDDQPY